MERYFTYYWDDGEIKMKIKDTLKRNLKKMFIHDCNNCGMCVENSVKLKIIEKNFKKEDEK